MYTYIHMYIYLNTVTAHYCLATQALRKRAPRVQLAAKEGA